MSGTTDRNFPKPATAYVETLTNMRASNVYKTCLDGLRQRMTMHYDPGREDGFACKQLSPFMVKHIVSLVRNRGFCDFTNTNTPDPERYGGTGIPTLISFSWTYPSLSQTVVEPKLASHSSIRC
jgi:hypothetical protein